MFSNPIIRIAIGVPIAAVIAFFLFVLMEGLIRVTKVCPPGQVENSAGECVKQDDRSLRNIFAEKPEVESVRSSREQVERRANAKKPPPPPKMSATKSNVDLPTPSISGAAPTEISFDRVTNIDVGAVVVNDRDAQPIRPPDSGPLLRQLQRIGKDAECEVSLNVDVQGVPYDVNATCNVGAYERAAEQAVAKARFAPKMVRGKPAERRGVVYPFEIRLSE